MSAAMCHVALIRLRRELSVARASGSVRETGPLPAELAGLPRPIMAYMGRVAIEKNIEAFLGASVPGTKLVSGNGPAREALSKSHPDALFIGFRYGDELAAMLSAVLPNMVRRTHRIRLAFTF